MILKFEDLDGNWNFREGDIRYRFTSITDVLQETFLEEQLPIVCKETEVIKKYEKELQENKRKGVFYLCQLIEKKYKEDEDLNVEELPTFFEIMKQYIAEHFDRADTSVKIDTSGLLSQDCKDIYGLYFIEIVEPTLDVTYVVLNCGDAYLLSDSGKTIEKLI